MARMHDLASGTRVKRLVFPGPRCLNAPHLQGSTRCGSSGPQCSSNETVRYGMQMSFASVAPSHEIEDTTERMVLLLLTRWDLALEATCSISDGWP
jgi:hypothetical protein